MSNCIFKKKHFIIIQVGKSDFIAYNKNKPFENGHTHINNLYIAKAIINYCLTGSFSDRAKHLLKNEYIRKSIERVSD